MTSRSLERGQVLVVAALFMAVLLVTAALAVDYSSWLVARRDYQGVVDAASLAGAGQLPAPGGAGATSTDQEHAAIEAMVYLSDHLGWGISRTMAAGNVANFLNQNVPYVPPESGYCVWIWTPVPASAITTSPNAQCEPTSSTLYSPATFAGDARKVFVRLQSLRPSIFAGVAGIRNELVSAIAVAGGAHLNYAVIALKPRLGSPDSQFGITINGGSNLIVPNGDVGGNYTLKWGGTGSSVTFSAGLSQVVDLAEPGTVQGSGSIVNGTIHQLEGQIEDPLYGTPPACTAAVTSPCWADDWAPPDVYPACENANLVIKHILDLNCLSAAELALPVTIWPGKYEQINIPSGATNVVMSPTCFSTDTSCLTANRGGVFYLTSTSSGSGLIMNGTPGHPSVLSGCGVLLIFDPYESGGSRVQLNVGGNGTTLNLNANTCNMKASPPNPSGTTLYKWYGYGASDFTNPISVWVRPNGSGYLMTSTNNGSNVITMGSGTKINENGVIYAPQDNTIVAGGGAGSGVGQIVSWTITYVGNSNITESFQGPSKLRTRLYQ